MKISQTNKNKLIAEYIRVENIVSILLRLTQENLDNQDLRLLYEKYLTLSKIYEKIFFRYKMLDLTFILLKRELSTCDILDENMMIEQSSAVYIFERLYHKFELNLRKEVEAFPFNEFEKYYLLST